MYAVFGLKRIITFITAVVVAVIIGLMLYKSPSDIVEFGKTAWRVASGVITAFILLGSVPFVFRFFWKCYETIFPSSYPDISGTWTGTVTSNYSVHNAIRNAAISTAETLDPLDPSQITSIDLQTFDAKLTIKASLLKIDLIMEVAGLTDTSESFSIAASPQVAQNSEAHGLAYIYKSKHYNKAADDEATHTGAAEVQLRKNANGELEMKGIYWTARNWRRAGNTAGILTFVRKKTI